MKRLIFLLLIFTFATTIAYPQQTYLRKNGTANKANAAKAGTDSGIGMSILGWGIGMGIAIGTIVLLIHHKGGNAHSHAHSH